MILNCLLWVTKPKGISRAVFAAKKFKLYIINFFNTYNDFLKVTSWYTTGKFVLIPCNTLHCIDCCDHIIFISFIIREQEPNITFIARMHNVYYNCWCVITIVRYHIPCYLIIYIKWAENQCFFNWPYDEKLFNDGNQVHHHVNVSLPLLPMKHFPN